jgi:hypothetical protein
MHASSPDPNRTGPEIRLRLDDAHESERRMDETTSVDMKLLS